MPKKPGALDARLGVGRRIERVAAVAGAHGVGERVPSALSKKKSRPAACSARERVVEVADRVRRIGDLQDEVGERRASSPSGAAVVAPEQAGERELNFLNAASSSKVPPSGCALGSRSLPPVRSPRQCIGPWLAMPRRLWVVIGPFMRVERCESRARRRESLRTAARSRSGPGVGRARVRRRGLPRSQARLSMSPKTWQLAHAESPWLEVSARRRGSGGPSTTLGGSGLCMRDVADLRCACAVSTTEMRVVEARQHVEAARAPRRARGRSGRRR